MAPILITQLQTSRILSPPLIPARLIPSVVAIPMLASTKFFITPIILTAVSRPLTMLTTTAAHGIPMVIIITGTLLPPVMAQEISALVAPLLTVTSAHLTGDFRAVMATQAISLALTLHTVAAVSTKTRTTA